MSAASNQTAQAGAEDGPPSADAQDELVSAAVACCPYCKTCFEVPEPIWNAPDSRVRCGECLDVFDVHLAAQDVAESRPPERRAAADDRSAATLASPATLRHLPVESLQKPVVAAEDFDAELDYTLADFDLYTDEESVADEELNRTPDSVEEVAPPVDAAPVPLPPSASVVDGSTSDSTAVRSASSVRRQRRRIKQIAIPAAALCAMVAGIVLARFSSEPAIYNSPLLRPVAAVVCSMGGCQVPPRSAIEQLVLLKRNVYTHPSKPEVLVIDATFENRAPFAQGYPGLSVRLSDRSGRQVDQQNFQPADYVDGWQPGATLAPQIPLDILLEVDDPGNMANTFELMFDQP